jgi:hypothetical protein
MKKSKYSIVRSQSAGVFMGIIKSRKGDEAVLTDARRLWYWSGAASLSQLSQDGVKNPTQCKFPVAVPSVTLLGVIEILPCTSVAEASVKGVPVWAK